MKIDNHNKSIVSKYKGIKFMIPDNNSRKALYVEDFINEENMLEWVSSYFIDKDYSMTRDCINFLKDAYGYEHIARLADKYNTKYWNFNSYENALMLFERLEKEFQSYDDESGTQIII